MLCLRMPNLCHRIELFTWLRMERPHLMSGADHRLWSTEMTGWRVRWKNSSEWGETPQSHLEKMTPSLTTLKMTVTHEVTVVVHFFHFWYFYILLAFWNIKVSVGDAPVFSVIFNMQVKVSFHYYNTLLMLEGKLFLCLQHLSFSINVF